MKSLTVEDVVKYFGKHFNYPNYYNIEYFILVNYYIIIFV